MENEVIKNKTEKLKRLNSSFLEKKELHRKKMMRARKFETEEFHSEKYKLYYLLSSRASDLAYNIRRHFLYEKRITDWGDAENIKMDYRIRLSKKAKGRENYLTKHKYGLWFLGSSLGADYGEFTCDKCGCTFYHSPSEITLAGKVVYNCCCGHCTNSIINRDWGEEPYF